MDIYFDNSATTRCYPEVAALAAKLMLEDYGNPSSLHKKGIDAERYVRKAADTFAGILHADRKEIFFTSGGTESNNWALAGTARANRRRGKHIIISSVEHPAVSAPAAALEEEGYEVTRLPVDENGLVDPDEAAAQVRPDTILVSVMAVNNEIGTLEPTAELGEKIKRKNPDTLFHVDAIQAFGKIPLDPGKMHVDLMSASGHKVHGPKGTGLLYIKKGTRIKPLIYGGGQQSNMRSGTDNVPGIAGFALAAEMMTDHMKENTARMEKVRDCLRDGLAAMDQVVIHTPSRHSVPFILNASFTGVRSEVLLHTLEDRGICVSAGSACSSHKRAGSPTLTATGAGKKEMESAVRFSFDENNTVEEAKEVLQVLQEVVPMLRRFVRR